MDTTMRQEYVQRIASANPVQLLITNYDITMDFMNERSEQGYNRARLALNQLMNALDFKYPIAAELYNLYIYVGECINAAQYKNETDRVESAVRVLKRLRDAYADIERDNPQSSRVMEGSQQIFAGLTYENGELKEYVDDDADRGYRI